MPKQDLTKKSGRGTSKKQLLSKQEGPPKEIKVKHPPPLSSKDIIAKAEANAAKLPKSKRKTTLKQPVLDPSSSEDSSDSESESDSYPPKVATQHPKTSEKPEKPTTTRTPAIAKSQKEASSGNSSSDSTSSSDDSSSESEGPKKTVHHLKANGTSKTVQSDSTSEEENSEEDTSEGLAANAKISNGQKVTVNVDLSDSGDGTSGDEKPKAQQIKPVPHLSADSSSETSSSSSEDSDDDSASDSESGISPKPPAAIVKQTQPAQGASSDTDSSTSEQSSDSGMEEDVEMGDRFPVVVTTGKRKAEDSPVFPAKKTKVANGPTTDARPDDGSTKTIFVGNLSWAVDNDRLSQEFADCGEVISARVQLDRNTGKSRGFGYITFATTEAVNAAIALNGNKEIDGRTLNLDKAVEHGPNKERRAQVFGDVRGSPSKVLFVGNLSWNTVEDTLWDAFSDYGDVTSVRLPTDKESGRPKGYGYVEFSAVDSAKKAIDAMNGKELDARQIRLGFAQPRDTNGPGRGRGAGFGSRGGGGRGGGRGRGADRGRGRGGARGGMRTGAITASEGRKITF